MSMWWDRCNKWLYVGTKDRQANQLVFLFDNYLNWFPKNSTMIREWTLFQIMWDNGAWWASDLTNVEKFSVPIMNGKNIERENFVKRSGDLNCFIQITILGIGIRFNYYRPVMVIHRGEENDNK